MRRKFRLTICAIALLAAACCAIVWVRSYSVKDVVWIGGYAPRISRVSTPPGRLVLSTRRNPYEGRWAWDRSIAVAQPYADSAGRTVTNYWFRVLKRPQFEEWHLPMWLLTSIFVAVGAACATPSRFSLRGALLAMAVVASVLTIGLLARKWPAPEPPAIFGGATLVHPHELLTGH